MATVFAMYMVRIVWLYHIFSLIIKNMLSLDCSGFVENAEFLCFLWHPIDLYYLTFIIQI